MGQQKGRRYQGTRSPKVSRFPKHFCWRASGRLLEWKLTAQVYFLRSSFQWGRREECGGVLKEYVGFHTQADERRNWDDSPDNLTPMSYRPRSEAVILDSLQNIYMHIALYNLWKCTDLILFKVVKSVRSGNIWMAQAFSVSKVLQRFRTKALNLRSNTASTTTTSVNSGNWYNLIFFTYNTGW